MVTRYFNSHSPSWGYSELDSGGEEGEDWRGTFSPQLLYTPEDKETFYSRRWQITSSPELAFCTDDIVGRTSREVQEQLTGVTIAQYC